jgi:hypothetical protein
MLLFRLILLLLMVAGAVCFAAFAFTGRPIWRERGMRMVKWALVAALAFGLVLLSQWLLAVWVPD